MKIEDCRYEQTIAHSQLNDRLVFRVRPTQITKMIKRECPVGNELLQPKPFFDYFIVGGLWENSYSLIKDDRIYREMVDLISFGDDFRRSRSYRERVTELRAGVPRNGIYGTLFETCRDIDESYRYYIALIASMRENGYLPILDTLKPTPERHVGVAITPGGEFLHFRTGHHRIAIAQLLNLESMLVQVHCVHGQWALEASAKFGGTELQSMGLAIDELSKEQGFGKHIEAHAREHEVFWCSGQRV